MPVALVTGTLDAKYDAIARRMLERMHAAMSRTCGSTAATRCRSSNRAVLGGLIAAFAAEHGSPLTDPQPDREQRGERELEADRSDQRGDERRRIAARLHQPDRRDRERRGCEPEQRPRVQHAARHDRDQRTGDARRRTTARARGAPMRTASVRLPATRSVSTSRTLFASRIPHAGSPAASAATHATRGQLAVLHVRAADRRDEPEEHEHHHLAQAEIAVGLRARRCR